MTDQQPWDTDEQELVHLLSQSGPGLLAEKMGIEIRSATRQRVVGTMPVEGNTQPYGILHGGASCVLAESLASLGAAVHGWPSRVALGTEINATHHRPGRSGVVTGVATPVHLGRSYTTWDVVITDDEDRRICTARVSCVLREN